MLNHNLLATDTIVAQASAMGRGGVGIIRLSGPNSQQIAQVLQCPHSKAGQVQHKRFKPRVAHLTHWFSETGDVIDHGITLFFPSPHSFTGEDVVELQAHGGVVILDWLVQRCIDLGARIARPGEFSERAFLNGKLDLAQAEAVADVIDAASREAAVCAGRSLQGAFSAQINELLELLIDTRVHVEAAIDFVDEDLETNDIQQLSWKLDEASSLTNSILSRVQTGVRLHEGARIAIVGAPNAGKSSLLNFLSQTSSAIVSDIPGTTRDVVKERIVLKGLPMEVLDTAGLRVTQDPIEQMGIQRAQEALKHADLIIWVFDVSQGQPEQVLSDFAEYLGDSIKTTPVLCLANKMDLVSDTHERLVQLFDRFDTELRFGAIHTEQGMPAFIDAILSQLGVRSGQEGQFMARRRHMEALAEVQKFLQNAKSIINVQPLELVAEELRLAQDTLGQITGQFTNDDLLGKIFSSFCVGK